MIKTPEFWHYFRFFFGILNDIFHNELKMCLNSCVYGTIQTIGEERLSQNCCDFWHNCSSFVICIIHSIVIFLWFSFFFYLFYGVELLGVTLKIDQCFMGTSWWFGGWLFYTGMNAKPPLFMPYFEKMTLCLNTPEIKGGLTARLNFVKYSKNNNCHIFCIWEIQILAVSVYLIIKK